MSRPGIVAVRHEQPAQHESQPEGGWIDFLVSRIDRAWRPGEFDFERLHFIPNPENPLTMLHLCAKAGCGTRLNRGAHCPSCGRSWAMARAQGVDYDEWVQDPRLRVVRNTGCLYEGCGRSHSARGLCRSHYYRFKARADRTIQMETWLRAANILPVPSRGSCVVSTCDHSAESKDSLCGVHRDSYLGARKDRIRAGKSDITLATWMSMNFEPYLDESNKTYASVTGLPFGVLPEPIRWEFLYAVQQRDKAGKAIFDPVDTRGLYKYLRDVGTETAIGLDGLGLPPRNSNVRGTIHEWQDHIDQAHREWSGLDTRDPWIIYIRDLELTRTVKNPPGPKASIDLRGFRNRWIAESLRTWMHSSARHQDAFYAATRAWAIVDRTLAARGTPKAALGMRDMDASLKELRKEWTNMRRLSKGFTAIEQLIAFARTDEYLAPIWADIPASFLVDRKRHPTTAGSTSSRADDEDFRFVPQPIVDWMLDHVSLFTHRDAYGTAEVQMMIFLQERVGRRTSETVRLREDCISYDSGGHPYLKWDQGKPPYGPGKRLPIHQETHDAIRQWQETKKESGVDSEWLFPSRAYVSSDRPYQPGYLADRLGAFALFVANNYPYPGTVEGSDGNLISFDISSVDPYAFRHAFAQRLADATDENGNSTTAPDVLQSFMGHKHFNTTMSYYKVTSRRKKRALESIPARRLDFMGRAVEIDRERDSYTRTPVTLGHCTEPHNVARHGDGCAIDYACESCPFFLVDPLERDGLIAKRDHMSIRLVRAQVINSPAHILDHYVARIADCNRIIDGIDDYIVNLPDEQRAKIQNALAAMADIRKRAIAARAIDIRPLVRPAPAS